MSRQSIPSVKISSLIKIEHISIIHEDIEKNILIEKIINRIGNDFPELKIKTVLQKVMHRENGISTTLDTGLSIPHARIDDIDNFIVSLALIPNGIYDSSQPEVLIKAMFLFLSPSDSSFFQKHLQLLSSLSAMFQPSFIDRLVSLNTPEQVIQEISAYK